MTLDEIRKLHYKEEGREEGKIKKIISIFIGCLIFINNGVEYN
ncbi:hypothetical protein [Clostridium sp.]